MNYTVDSPVQKHRTQRVGLNALVYIVYNLYYISDYNVPAHNYVVLGIFLVWNFFALLEDHGAYMKSLFSAPMGFLTVFLLFYLISSLFVADLVYTMSYLMVYLTFFGSVLPFLYYYNRKNLREIRWVVIGAMLSFLLFAVRAVLFYAANPSAARILAADPDAFGNIAIGGGYAIAFGAAILSVYLFEKLINGQIRGLRMKLFVAVLILLFLLLIIQTESTTTFLAAIVGILCSLIKRLIFGKQIHASAVKKTVGSVLIIGLALLILLNINNIGAFFMDITSGDSEAVFSRRIYRIAEKMYYFGTGKTTDSYVDERWMTVQMSLETFVKHPLLGVGYKCGNIFSSLGRFGVGTHSEFADLLAQHGILGGMWYFLFLFSAMKKKRGFSNCRTYLITTVIMMLFNPFQYYHGYFVILALIPLLECVLSAEYRKDCERRASA